MQKGFNKISIRRILVRGTNWLGDAVMTTPALGIVRDYFPEARITMLANPLVAELFASHPWIDDVMIYDRKGRHAGLKGRLLMAGELKARSFDLAILLPNSLDSAFVTWLARIPRRLGYATDGRGLLLTDKVPLSARMLTGHQTGYYLAMLEYFGIDGSPRSQLLTTTIAEDAVIRELL